MQNEILNEISKILEYCPCIEKGILFGSRARGDNSERSDFDIALFGQIPLVDKNNIFLKLQSLPTLLKIDITYFDELEEGKFKDNIKKEGVIFYDRKTTK